MLTRNSEEWPYMLHSILQYLDDVGAFHDGLSLKSEPNEGLRLCTTLSPYRFYPYQRLHSQR